MRCALSLELRAEWAEKVLGAGGWQLFVRARRLQLRRESDFFKSDGSPLRLFEQDHVVFLVSRPCQKAVF